jgi:hypothetical protein
MATERGCIVFPVRYELNLYMLCGQPLWSSGQSSWLQIQRSGFDSRCYKIFWDLVGLEPGPLILVSTIEKLIERKSSGFGLENRDYGRRRSANYATPLYPQKLALTSTSGGRSVGIVRSRTPATEFVLFVLHCIIRRRPVWDLDRRLFPKCVVQQDHSYLYLSILADFQNNKTFLTSAASGPRDQSYTLVRK